MQLGVIGLGTMGANLARNAARKGAQVAVFNRTAEKVDAFMKEHGGEGDFFPSKTLEELVKNLKTPRAVLLMVNAGKPVDEVIEAITPLLQKRDILIDAGNSHYLDTERRTAFLATQGIRFLGMGVSGGEEGALRGPSMMPGGDESAYEALEPLFQKMAADVPAEAPGSGAKAGDGQEGKCVTYIGPGGAGHFVKMVHNGIEYADMQLIAEAYHLLSYLHPGLSNEELAETFEEWNTGDDLKSYLVEITVKIFRKKDDLFSSSETGAKLLDSPHRGSLEENKNRPNREAHYLLDCISDVAKQKGTGKWVTQTALDLGVPIPTITAAVDARFMAALKEDRVKASKMTKSMKVETPKITPEDVRHALFLSKIVAYAQGLMLIHRAGKEYGWKLNLSGICRIWQGGCIIRSSLLGIFSKAYKKNPDLESLLLDTDLFGKFQEHHGVWRDVLKKGIGAGVPLPAMGASMAYFDSYFHERLPQNLTQAQRDFFGAHGYERVDKEGTFHTKW